MSAENFVVTFMCLSRACDDDIAEAAFSYSK
jgi:hypothetical protein